MSANAKSFMEFRCSFAALAILMASCPAWAGDIRGLWLTEDASTKVEIHRCGQDLCGRIVWLREPTDPATGGRYLDKFNKEEKARTRPLLGLILMHGLKSDSANLWRGALYNPLDGETYEGKLSQQGDEKLKLEGCAFRGLICQGEVWTRSQ